MVDGNGSDGSLEAIGQGPSSAEPLPGAADGQGKLQAGATRGKSQTKQKTWGGNGRNMERTAARAGRVPRP